MTTSLVTPGAKVGHHPSQIAGPGVAVQGDDLIATVVGQPTEADGVISVLPARHVINIDIGDRIIATVDKVQEKNAEVVVLAVEGKGEAPVATQLRAQVRVTDIVDRFLHQVSDGLR